MKFKGILFLLMASLFSGSCESGFEDMIDETNMAKAALKSVTLSSGSLSPEFRREKRAYSINPGSDVTSVTVTAVPENSDSKIKYRIDGGSWEEGDIIIEGVSEESLIKLDIKVTSGDGKGVVVYAFDVKRSSITPDRSCTVTFVCPEADIDPEFYSLTVETPGSVAGTLPVSQGRYAYAFAGWFTGENGTGTQFTKDTVVTGDITVYAYWKGGTSGLSITGGVVTSGSVSSGEVVIPDYTAAGEKVTGIAGSAFSGKTGITSVLIPGTVITIGEQAFSGCTGLTSVTLTSGVKTIGASAFFHCDGLTSVTLPATVTSIGASAFSRCFGLISVTIPSGVTTIGNYAFYICSKLTSVTIPSGVTTIGNYAFYNCSKLTSVTIPSGVTTIGNSAFSYCTGLTSVTIPSGVTSIGENAFSNCSGLTSVTIPSGVTTIGNYAFYHCSKLTSVTIPDSVTSIGDYAFSHCSGLESVTIPSGVTSIGDNTFSYCTGLTSVTIPSSVISIGISAFSYCTGLTSVRIYCNPAITPGTDCFLDVSGEFKVHILNGATGYTGSPWNAFTIVDDL